MRLIRRAAICGTVLLTLCVLAVNVGRAQNLPQHLQALGFAETCDGAPCLGGVTPGETPWYEAQRLFAGYREGELQARRILLPVGRPADRYSEIAIFPSVDGRSVGRINFKVAPEQAVTAGWIIKQYGLPCGVSIYYDWGIITLRYPEMLANVAMPRQHLSTQAAVLSLQFHDPAFEASQQLNPCVDLVTGWKMLNRRWQGFASLLHYRQHR